MKFLRGLICVILAISLLISFPLAVCAEDSSDCGAKLLAITFDDGPGSYTNYLLDELSKRGAYATFFVAGYRAANYSDILSRMVKEGHQLANHSYSHENLNTLSAESIQKTIGATQNLITAAGGSENAYVRPPYGNANAKVKSAVNVPLIHWSVDPEDWKYKNSKTVSDNIVSRAYDGSIILVHDIYKSSVDGALNAIDRLQALGYEFVTVEQLLLRRGIQPQGGTMYFNAKNNGINLTAWQASPEYYDETKLEQHWGYKEMASCIEKGILLTGPLGEWFPNCYISRGEFVRSLAIASGVKDSYPINYTLYSDIENRDLLPYLTWAYDQGFMNGFADGTFHENEKLNREQMATVIARILDASGKTLHYGIYSPYQDESNISSWAYGSVIKCTQTEILQGMNGYFRPKLYLTRAQTATVLERLF